MQSRNKNSRRITDEEKKKKKIKQSSQREESGRDVQFGLLPVSPPPLGTSSIFHCAFSKFARLCLVPLNLGRGKLLKYKKGKYFLSCVFFFLTSIEKGLHAGLRCVFVGCIAAVPAHLLRLLGILPLHCGPGQKAARAPASCREHILFCNAAQLRSSEAVEASCEETSARSQRFSGLDSIGRTRKEMIAGLRNGTKKGNAAAAPQLRLARR